MTSAVKWSSAIVRTPEDRVFTDEGDFACSAIVRAMTLPAITCVAASPRSSRTRASCRTLAQVHAHGQRLPLSAHRLGECIGLWLAQR